MELNKRKDFRTRAKLQCLAVALERMKVMTVLDPLKRVPSILDK
jgi:hypothetical protein